MASLGELKAKYDEMDPVSRQNLWFAVIGVILLILLVISLNDTASVLKTVFGKGAKAAGENIAQVSNLTKQ